MPGRGRGRGKRRGRGRRGGLGVRSTEQSEKTPHVYSLQDDPKAYFTGTASCKEHLAAQKEDRTRYAATLSVMISTGIQVAQNACIRALAMAWARNDKELAGAFLSLRSKFGLVEVLRALNILDSGRQCRVLEKRLKCLQLSGAKVKPKKLGRLKSDIDNLTKLKPPEGSVSGAICKHVTSWVRSFTAEDLEFFAVNFPKEPWKKLADICHLNPQKDFPSAPWFLPHCFGTGSLPENSMVQQAISMTALNVNEIVANHNIPFSVVKKFSKNLDKKSKKRIAEYEKLDTVLWYNVYIYSLLQNGLPRSRLNVLLYGSEKSGVVDLFCDEVNQIDMCVRAQKYYEDLRCPEVDAVLDTRLAAEEQVNLPNGKLLERLLTILLLRRPEIKKRYLYTSKPYYKGEPEGVSNFFTRLIELAEPRLTSIRLSLESPIVVMGDASASMDVAIRTSTIIASLLTAICSAKLVFFNAETRDALFLPKTVKEMLKLAVTKLASGGTTPASSLYPFYKKKEVVKTIIVVTDEEENGECHGYRFAALYKKYHDEVYPAHLVFVSFLRGQHASGQMVTALQKIGFSPKQLRLEGSRPDLCKLDDLFAQLSAKTTSSFSEQLEVAERGVRESGVGVYLASIGEENSKKFQDAPSKQEG